MTGDLWAVAVDVGNSAVKVALSHERRRAFSTDEVNWIGDAVQWLRSEMPNASKPDCWVSTVNFRVSNPLRDSIIQQGWNWNEIKHDDVPIECRVEFPERVGIDRLLGAFAASTRYELPLVVVDAGSAVTVDWVQANGDGAPVFHGGAILPGLRLQLAALSGGTEGISEKLAAVEENGAPRTGFSPGKSTSEAIRMGAGAAVVGGVDRLIEEYGSIYGAQFRFSSDLPGAPGVLLTGGDSPLVSQYLNADHSVIPNLVCLGALDVANRSRGFSSGGLK